MRLLDLRAPLGRLRLARVRTAYRKRRKGDEQSGRSPREAAVRSTLPRIRPHPARS
jgi:hypothetical protein